MIDAATPAYLSCTIGKQVVEITADEANQTAQIFWPKWRISAPAAAVYSPERVIITVTGTTYEIDRTSLAVTSRSRPPLGREKVEAGTCEVRTPPAGRKF